MKQLPKKFTDYQIKELITRYLKKKIEREYIRSTPTRAISKAIEIY